MTSLWRLTQACSGLAISVFASAHIANQLTAAVSQRLYDSTMLMLREAYQRPMVEIGGAVAIAVHLFSNFQLRRKSVSPPTTLHTLTGYVLASTLGLHVYQVRIAPMMRYNAPADFAYVHSIFQHSPIMLPLYSLLLMAGIYHTFHGISRAVAILQIGKINPALTNSVISASSMIGVIALLGMNGGIYQVDTFHHEVMRFARSTKQHLTNRW